MENSSAKKEKKKMSRRKKVVIAVIAVIVAAAIVGGGIFYCTFFPASLKIEDGTGYGHAELLALAAQEVTGGDIFPIKVDDLYPETYGGAFDRHHRETGTSIRPELTEHLESIENYDTVIIIYPNWLSSMPVPVLSFLEEYDFSGKTIIPFNVHNGSRFSGTIETIQSLEPDAEVITDGFTVSERDVAEAAGDVADWIRGLGY